MTLTINMNQNNGKVWKGIT